MIPAIDNKADEEDDASSVSFMDITLEDAEDIYSEVQGDYVDHVSEDEEEANTSEESKSEDDYNATVKAGQPSYPTQPEQGKPQIIHIHRLLSIQTTFKKSMFESSEPKTRFEFD